jgi:hypothetical protein
VPVATYGAGYEADLALARLEAEGIPAVRRGNDIVGILGPGFEGTSSRGVTVLVPSALVDDAREVLAPADGTV